MPNPTLHLFIRDLGKNRGAGIISRRFRWDKIVSLLLPSILLLPLSGSARNLISGNGPAGANLPANQAASAATSQTATAATAATAQAVQAAATARHAQDSFVKAAAAFQTLQASQAAARALATAAPSTIHDGLGAGGLNPLGGLSPASGSAIQVIQLGSGGKGQLSLGSSGSVTLPNGTPGSDQISVTGAGTVTTAGGTVTTTAGSVMTTIGGTLAATNGGTISLTAGSGTLTTTTNATITSTLAGTVTLPAGGGTMTLAAGQSAPIPAGSTISFAGTSAGTVSVTGTVALTGAGTLALANAAASSSGGTITTTSGTTTFTNGGKVSSLPAGSQISLIGSGTISLTGTTDGSSVAALPIIVPPSSSGTGVGTFNFTTTGTVLSTQGFQLPVSWSGVGALSESKSTTGAVTDTITQSASEALLYWSSFNIGKNTTLDFDQSAGGANASSWVAINQIVNDPSLAPSQILGAIQAPGQVYVINQNGIIFGGSSQINTHALVASSLPINTNLIAPENLLGASSTQDQFLFSQLVDPVLAGVANPLPAFNPGNVVSVASSAAGNTSLTLASSVLPSGFGVGSILLGSTVQSISGKTVTLASPANAALANAATAYSMTDGSCTVQVVSATTGRGATRVTLGSSTLPPGFGVGSQLLGATVTAISGNTVTLSATPNAAVANLPEAYTNSTGTIRTDGDVVVQAGAQLTSPTTAEHVGGKFALIGPVVRNDGVIQTPDGQTILAAGLQVGFTPHDPTDPTLRGLDVFVGSVGTGTDAGGVANGTVTNNGIIASDRADITLAGKDIEQNGTISSVTSVALDGRIDLLADYGALQGLNGAKQAIITPSQTGTVNLGVNSITEILPDTTGATVVGGSLVLPSLVNIESGTINLLGNGSGAGAQIIAPGAQAVASSSVAGSQSDGTVDLTGQALTSGVNLTAGSWVSLTGTSVPVLALNMGQINLQSGANIDVSGSQNVAASVTENIVAAQLRGTELADSPLQQNGPLRGKTVDIDVSQSGVYKGVAYIGSAIGDLSGYAGLVQHTVNELTVNGGSVGLQAGAGVNIATGSTINVSGGSIDYQGGLVSTTKVVTAGGQVIDISQATPDQIYQGLETGFTVASPKWGVTQTFGESSPAYYEAGYIQGGNGGSLSISAPSLAMQGNLFGNTVAGTRQVGTTQQVQITELNSSGTGVAVTVAGLSQFSKASFTASSSTASDNFMTQLLLPIDAVPTTSSLVVNLFPQLVVSGQPVPPAIAPEDVVFQPSTGGAVNPFASSGNPILNLSADLVNLDGFGNLTVEGNAPSATNYNATRPLVPLSTAGNIALPAGVALTTQQGGSLILAGINIDIEGSISSPGGTLNFTTQNLVSSSESGVTNPLQAVAGRGDFTLGSGASLSTAGLIVNNSVTSPTANTLPNAITGGVVSIKSLNADFQTGSTIDASGGVLISAKGATTYGAAGKIDIEAGRDTAPGNSFGIIGGTFYLGSTLTAYSGALGGGGGLTIVAPAIQVGGISLQNGLVGQESKDVWGDGTTLLLDRAGGPDFFSQGGFSTFSMTGLGLAPITYSGGVATQLNPYASTPGVSITAGTVIAPVVQSYQEITNSGGVDLAATTYALASQRNPVNLTFNASGVTASVFQPQVLVVRGDLVMGAGAVIETDPLSSVTLKGQTATVLGQVYAPGGNITVQGAADSKNLFSGNTSSLYSATDIAPTVDLGPSSILSTQGIAEATFNGLGFNTGNVLNGGTITISGNIVAEQNSVLNVSGASGVFDVAPSVAGVTINSSNSRQYVPLQETSNGGAITFNGQEELFVDSTLLGAAGGSGAQAGSLSITNGFSNYSVTSPGAQTVQTQLDATLVVSQSGLTRDPAITGQAVIGSQIVPANAVTDVDGDAVMGYFSANTNIFSSTALSGSTLNNGGVAGGIGSLTLIGTVQFAGPVSIAPTNRLVVATNPALTPNTKANIVAGGIIYANDVVNLSSGYVQLGLPFAGPSGSVAALPVSTGTGSLAVTASALIDVGNLQLQGIHNLSLATAGDVRGDGTLEVAGDISITAAQIYPTTETTFTIAALDAGGTNSTVTLSRPNNSLPALPLSAGGTLDIYADTIVQNGVLRAPIGTINLGSLNPPTGMPITSALMLGANSVTSVSAIDPNTGLGITIPYGSIDSNGNWIDPAGNTITAGSTPTLPGKAINFSATSITTNSGSSIDVRGGGDLIASQFVSGTGGLNNILGSTSSFAIVPSANQATYAAFDTSAGFSTGAYANLQVGDQIYLAGGSGLAAGTYTLLPASYALLPGAFLITPKSGTSNGSAVAELDGSVLTSGYRTSSLNGSREQSVSSLFEIDSQAVIKARAQYLTSSANTYFPQSAASLDVASPRLSVDAGQVVFQAAQSLTIPNTMGTLLGQAGPGGLGSIVDISSSGSTAINIYNSTDATNLPMTGDLNLDASALNAFGADSLLIGGFRTFTSTGTQVTVATGSLTVNNSGAPLIGPDVILVSNGLLAVDANAAIESTEGSTVSAPLLHLAGDNAVLRVSSDANAQIVRAGVTANTAGPNLAIGGGAVIGSAASSPSSLGKGSVILDSTSAASLDSQAVLRASAVSLNSGQITLVLPTLVSPLSSGAQGLVISSATLANLQATTQNLSLLSYTSLDIAGSGTIGAPADASGDFQVQSLALHASEIRGFDDGGNAVAINAKNVVLDNSANGTNPGPMAGSTLQGTLAINAASITLGVNALAIDQFAAVTLSASGNVVLSNGTGILSAAGDLVLSTPLLTSAPLVPLTPLQELNGTATPRATTQTIRAGGALTLTNPGGTVSTVAEGLGSNVTLVGISVAVNSNIQLPSGMLTIVATTGDLTVGGNLSVNGTTQAIYSLTQYTSGGQVSLTSYAGNVNLNSGSTVNVSAPAAGGNAGEIAVSAPNGTFTFTGSTMLGQGGSGGQGGTFSLDTGSLGGTSLSPLQAALNPVVPGAVTGDTYLGGFTQAQSIRTRSGDVTVDGISATDAFNLSTDAGSITVSGKVIGNSGQADASGIATATLDVSTSAATGTLINPGANGGSINLEANGSVTLLSGSLLSVAAQMISDAGRGGTITLDAGAETNGQQVSSTQGRDGTGIFSGVPVINVQTGSVIDLSVAQTSRSFDGSVIAGTSGTLNLRAPQTSSNTDVQIDPINGTIINSSHIVIEGVQVFDLTSSGGAIDSLVESNVQVNGNQFVGSMGTGNLFANNTSLAGLATIEPGAELINTNGDLTLANTWDLSLFRFGSNNNVAGDLTLRASGNVVLDFGASLTDGFTTNPNPSLATYGIWSDVLMPAGSSWSYRIVAGADFGAADFRQVLPISQANALMPSAPNALADNSGSVVLGMNTPLNSLTGDTTVQIMSTSNNGLGYFQTIRTGTGNIDIASGRDVQILNNVATIYTAGSQVNPGSGFDVPVLTDPTVSGNSNYNYPSIGGTIATAQYSQKGGNITISAQGNVAHYSTYDPTTGLPIVAYDINGSPLMADSSKELPTNWLYRRGFDNGGNFDTNADGQVASTTWWIDFSNFFEGIGALGGGDVTLKAGGNISNIDAVVPTNAYLSQDLAGDALTPANALLTEVGGGDLMVHAGNTIDGGVYYVERGNASLAAGGSVTTNATRNVSVTASSETDLPTTFFLGKGSINVAAGGDLELGPVVNAFLMPQDINNTVNDKSYFSTYAASDSVSASSLAGAVTLQDAFSSSTIPPPENTLFDFYNDQLTSGHSSEFSSSAPWVGSVETNLTPFATVMELLPPALKVTSFSGDINVQGNLTLFPSPIGTIDLVAAGSVNAFQPISVDTAGVLSWATSKINLSDANPNSIPGVLNPLSYAANSAQRISLGTTDSVLFNPINSLFNVSGSTTGSFALLTTQQTLHANLPINPSDPNSALGPLHAADTNPIHIYAATGDIDGLELFSGKFSNIVAGNDIADISLYVQNVNSSDITLVEAGRDIVVYDKNSLLREETHVAGGIYLDENDDSTNPSSFLPDGGAQGAPNAGDIQIAGPGTLEVLAGRNLTLGDGPSNGDGTGLGIVSIGNTTDPYLTTFDGADIVGAAGLGGPVLNVPNLSTSAFGLDPAPNSSLAFSNTAGTGFIDQFLNPHSQANGEADRYLPVLGSLLGVTGASETQIWNIFSGTPDTSLSSIQQGIQAKLTPASRDELATTIFYDVLRDAGRDHNSPTSPDVGTYKEGSLAIAALFPSSTTYHGDISLTAREIKTTNVGNISLLAPGGSLDVGVNNSGAQAIDQGILTVSGGNISIFTDQNVAVGTSRIFTLHGGDIIIWSANGDIAAGASSKTVQSAPPTRVLIDPTSGNVQTDLAGLATGGGIGVLETVQGAPPGNVDLIAPNGTVDAGDAGIRSSGNINIAAATILNAGNIQSGGSTSGVASTPSVNIGATVAASSAAGSSQNAATEAARQQQPNQNQEQDLPSIISVEVIGYSADDSADIDSGPYPMVVRSNAP